jgi:hypothetical protein
MREVNRMVDAQPLSAALPVRRNLRLRQSDEVCRGTMRPRPKPRNQGRSQRSKSVCLFRERRYTEETTTMKQLQSTSPRQEPKSEATQSQDAYRAPRLVTLGTTVRLVQGGCTSGSFDGTGGYRC